MSPLQPQTSSVPNTYLQTQFTHMSKQYLFVNSTSSIIFLTTYLYMYFWCTQSIDSNYYWCIWQTNSAWFDRYFPDQITFSSPATSVYGCNIASQMIWQFGSVFGSLGRMIQPVGDLPQGQLGPGPGPGPEIQGAQNNESNQILSVILHSKCHTILQLMGSYTPGPPPGTFPWSSWSPWTPYLNLRYVHVAPFHFDTGGP